MQATTEATVLSWGNEDAPRVEPATVSIGELQKPSESDATAAFSAD
jgi:hypothetical protein